MLDSTPDKLEPPQGRNEIINAAIVARLAYYRRVAEQAARAHQREPRRSTIARIGAASMARQLSWRGDLAVLRDCIDLVSDWGPFELVETRRIDAETVFCRFDYHGPAEHRAHYEKNLEANLRQIAPLNSPAQETAPAHNSVA